MNYDPSPVPRHASFCVVRSCWALAAPIKSKTRGCCLLLAARSDAKLHAREPRPVAAHDPPWPWRATALLLAKADGTAQDAAIGQQTGGRVSFFLYTDDFARDYAAMQAKGVTFKEEPRHEAYGSVVVFQDPFGNLWDLIEPK